MLSLGPSLPILVTAMFLSTREPLPSTRRDSKWLDIQPGGSWFFAKPEADLDDQLKFSVSTTREELSSKPEVVLNEILKNVFFAVNWSDLVNTTEKLEKLIREGQAFNKL